VAALTEWHLQRLGLSGQANGDRTVTFLGLTDAV
jgi:hypothetical protein